MTIASDISQRDLVALSLLTCGSRSGAKDQPAAKGTQSSSNAEPWRGYDRR
jgi:hypothetical protein